MGCMRLILLYKEDTADPKVARVLPYRKSKLWGWVREKTIVKSTPRNLQNGRGRDAYFIHQQHDQLKRNRDAKQ